MIDPKKQGHSHSLSLLQAAMSLLRGLWQGRHDAALIALRSSVHFWENLTKPLLSPIKLPLSDEEKVRQYDYMFSFHIPKSQRNLAPWHNSRLKSAKNSFPCAYHTLGDPVPNHHINISSSNCCGYYILATSISWHAYSHPIIPLPFSFRV